MKKKEFLAKRISQFTNKVLKSCRFTIFILIVRPPFVDGHQHVHVIPEVAQVCNVVEFDIDEIRS